MLNVINLPPGDLLTVLPHITDYKCFMDLYASQKGAKEEDRVPLRETIIYIILLYDKESFLNKKPIAPLQVRINRAAAHAGLDPEDEKIQKAIFYLDNEAVRNTVVDYLLFQNISKWSNRCAIEAQMAENLRIRFKPIEKEKADKDILNKHLLTDHYRDYDNEIKKLDADIFMGHDNVKNEAVRTRSSIESMIK